MLSVISVLAFSLSRSSLFVGVAWFGALNEVVARWLLVDDAQPLEAAYPTLRALLLRGVGVSEARISAVPMPDTP